MIRSLSSRMPAAWRCTVMVERHAAGRHGLPGETTLHEVRDCLVSDQQSAEDAQTRSDAPDTTVWLYGPVGGDFLSTDQVVIPGPEGTAIALADGSTLEGAGPLLRPWGRFRVSGDPGPTPLGVRVPLAR